MFLASDQWNQAIFFYVGNLGHSENWVPVTKMEKIIAERTFFGSCQSILIWKLEIRFRICTILSTTISGHNRKLFRTFFGSCQSILIWKLEIRFRICTILSTTISGHNRKLFSPWEVRKNLASFTKISQKIPKIHILLSSSNNLNKAYCILSKFGIEMPDTCRYVIGKSEGQKRPQNINFCTFLTLLDHT